MDTTTTTIPFVLALTLLTTGCGFHYRHAIPTMRSDARAELSCDEEIEVLRVSGTAYASDEAYVARGCGQELWFTCAGEGDEMSCSRRAGAVLSTPLPSEAHAIVKVFPHFRSPLATNARFRKHWLRAGDALVSTIDTNEVRAIPVAPGPMHWSYETSDVDVVREVHTHHWSTPYSYTVGNYVYSGVNYYTSRTETSRQVTRASCNVAFTLDAAPGSTYRVLYDYDAEDGCIVLCAEERQTASGVELAPCTSFQAG